MSEKLQRLTNPVFQDFVIQNEQVDINDLILGKTPESIDAREAAEQILSRRKAREKLPTWYATSGLVFPPPLSIEQSSSEQTALYKKTILQGQHLIDLTGGMGVDLITLSENFNRATHVEIDPWLSSVFKYNASKLTNSSIQSSNQSAEDFLGGFEGRASFFIDPARRDSDKKKVFLFEDCSPNVVSLLNSFREKAQQVLVKAAPMIDIKLGIQQLKFVKEVHVVSLENECKEVLFLLDFEMEYEPEIHCINLKKGGMESFRFHYQNEKDTEVVYSPLLKYIYEPNASIRKAGAFKAIASHYQLNKVAPNTHLYISEDLNPSFPGRIFEVQSEVNKRNIKTLFPNQKANVISKNHPLTSEQLKKKLNLKDGGEQFVLAFRDQSNKPQMVVCTRIT
ncbi:hypothetical protein [Marinoscillum sp. MHG1-6]|uniref:THUMP-like domain-containing protein n=1 Tax=Marinoscillum sp. MHG1-6 TaxID=2959627 RepID=UPI0021579CF4|nr:hypothetical protein [Marinoscillum sp. MHG1-6]